MKQFILNIEDGDIGTLIAALNSLKFQATNIPDAVLSDMMRLVADMTGRPLDDIPSRKDIIKSLDRLLEQIK